MRLGRRTLVPAALALSTAVCSSPTAPPELGAIVTVAHQTLPVTVVRGGSVTWIEVTVPVRIDNTGPAPLRFFGCASGLEVRAGDQWSGVYSPVCLAASASLVEIPPGERREFAVGVTAAIQGSAAPAWRGTGIDGTYRFVAGLVRPGRVVIPTVPSNAFTLASGS